MDDILQRAEKAWSEMDMVTREVVAEILFMLVVKHARSLWLKNQELEAKNTRLWKALNECADELEITLLSELEGFYPASALKEDVAPYRAVLKETQHDMAT